MKKSILTFINLFLISLSTQAQVTGSTDLCPANVYSYSASIAGASSYTWTLPNGWYNSSGQGTATITATCNVMAGNVCAEGFSSNGTSMGTVCLNTIFGGGASGWDVMPANSGVCNGGGNVVLSIVPNGTGGSCGNGCGNGTPVPNLKYCIYDDQWPNGNWVGFIDPFGFTSNGGVYYIYQCDVAAGLNPPQAVRVEGGCGAASVSNIATVTSYFPIPPMVYQDPIDPCVGDTVALYSMGVNTCWGCMLMINGMTLISPQFANSAYFELTSLTASTDVSAMDMNGCLAGTQYIVTTGTCNPTLVNEVENAEKKLFVYLGAGDGNLLVILNSNMNNKLQIINTSGQIVFEDNNFKGKSKIEISEFSQGVYFVKVNNEQVKFVKL